MKKCRPTGQATQIRTFSPTMYTCEHTVVASLERQNLKCELDQEGNEKSIFSMIPKSKIDRVEGENSYKQIGPLLAPYD